MVEGRRMIKTLAAIWYTCDQNAPSEPFLLRLEVAVDTKEAVAQALLVYVKDYYEDDKEFADQFKLSDSPHWGEWEIGDGSTFLIVSGDDNSQN
jgi:hypothetical protein